MEPDEEPTEEELDGGLEGPEADWNPIGAIQSALADADPSAMVAGFVCIVEWIEEDGSNAISVLTTPMPPWHAKGLIEYARDYDTEPLYPVVIELDDDDE